MKCPKCGGNIKEDSKCEKCGFEIKNTKYSNGFEIEYKEFKISELLEIHKKPLKQQYNKTRENTLSKKDDTTKEKYGSSINVKKIFIYAITLIIILIFLFIAIYFIPSVSH